MDDVKPRYYRKCLEGLDHVIDNLSEACSARYIYPSPDVYVDRSETNKGLVEYLGSLKECGDEEVVVWFLSQFEDKKLRLSLIKRYANPFLERHEYFLRGTAYVSIVRGKMHRKRVVTYENGQEISDSFVDLFAQGNELIVPITWPNYGSHHGWHSYQAFTRFCSAQSFKHDENNGYSKRFPYVISVDPKQITDVLMPSSDFDQLVDCLVQGDTSSHNLSDLTPGQASEIGYELLVLRERIHT